MEYLNETKNNRDKLEKNIETMGIVEIGCVNCIAIYPRIKNMDNLKSLNNSLLCHVCGKETIIPIVEDSYLKKCKSFEQQIKKLEEWNKVTFREYVNRCVICGIDMGLDNPRQLCRKTYCENDN